MAHQAVRISVLTSVPAELPVGNWLARRAGLLDAVDVDFIDLETARLPDHRAAILPDEGAQPSAVHDLVPWLLDADGFIVVLLGRLEGIPSPVRNALEWCTTAWAGKPVALVTNSHAHPDPQALRHIRAAFGRQQAMVTGTTGVCPDRLGCSTHCHPDQANTTDRLLAALVAAARHARISHDNL
ncbi:NADPH-dependent FMN reductase [Phytoactinopolyspora limicola]|uniref:NADPH-dependent FMN reductase n=1 Tax=Phytoactinopolyspora limicola TaxID=2715536 RepID=UPI00140A3B9E|nr:NAD(P)H-dependent oxidoreductase [Phytoactinopolyspora limicola]